MVEIKETVDHNVDPTGTAAAVMDLTFSGCGQSKMRTKYEREREREIDSNSYFFDSLVFFFFELKEMSSSCSNVLLIARIFISNNAFPSSHRNECASYY